PLILLEQEGIMLLSDLFIIFLVLLIVLFICFIYIKIMIVAKRVKYKGGWLGLYVDLHKRMIPFFRNVMSDKVGEKDMDAIADLERSILIGFVIMMIFAVFLIVASVFVDMAEHNFRVF